MTLTASVVRFKVQLSHVDRGVYATLDLKMAKHPSENHRYLLTRLLAFCALYEEGLAFSKGGLSSPDEPALATHTLDGRLMLWVEIGNPAAARLHKASKAAPRVVVFTHHDAKLLVADVAVNKVHRADAIEVIALAGAFLDALDAQLGERGGDLDVTITEDQLYINCNGTTLEGAFVRVKLTSPV